MQKKSTTELFAKGAVGNTNESYTAATSRRMAFMAFIAGAICVESFWNRARSMEFDKDRHRFKQQRQAQALDTTLARNPHLPPETLHSIRTGRWGIIIHQDSFKEISARLRPLLNPRAAPQNRRRNFGPHMPGRISHKVDEPPGLWSLFGRSALGGVEKWGCQKQGCASVGPSGDILCPTRASGR